MKRALAAILISAALLAPLSGCASIFDKEYVSVTDFPESTGSPISDGARSVKNYLDLKLAINSLVSMHEESGTLDFSNYNGSNISDDLAAAAKEVSTETALSDYAVDYISYDLDRSVMYYEAEVYIYYRRTAEEVEAVVSESTVTGLRDAISEALNELQTELVVMVSAAGASEDEVAGYVTAAYLESPLSCVIRPKAEVTMYSGGGLQRIYEIVLDYGEDTETLEEMKSGLEEELTALAERVTAQGAPHRALQAATVLMKTCLHDEEADSSLWAALHEGRADSEGMAVAYKALCDAVGVECEVVTGRLDRAEHYWNIVTVDGESYHVDVSLAREQGFAGTFFISDAEMWGRYWWDNEDYPQCEGSLSYSALVKEPKPEETPGTSPSPEVSPSPDISPAPETSPEITENP